MLRPNESEFKAKILCDVCCLFFDLFHFLSRFLFGVNGPEPGPDLGFPVGGSANLRSCQNFPKNCIQFRKFWTMGRGGAGGVGALLRSATVNTYRQRHLNKRHSIYKVLFTRSVNITVSVSGIFDLFNVTCKQCHRSPLNHF